MLTRGQKWGLGIIGVGVLVAMSAPTKVRAMVNTGRQRKFPAEPYEVTAEDKLWLARAVDAEGPRETEVARALVNLFVYALDHGYNGTLGQMVRSYAQPVNPRWFITGDLFKAHVTRLPLSARKAAFDAAKRRETVHSVKTSFPQGVKDAVNAALGSGFHSDVTDYAEAFADATDKGYERRSDDLEGQNTLWSRAPGWGGYDVQPGNMLVKA